MPGKKLANNRTLLKENENRKKWDVNGAARAQHSHYPADSVFKQIKSFYCSFT